jgi:DNA-binding NarL/FixJ family response regulator
MRHPRIVVFETDGTLARSLEPVVQGRRWLLRQPRQTPACLKLLCAGAPAILVFRMGRHLVRELSFLSQVHNTLPDVGVVVVADTEDPALAALALELGASFVLQPPQPRPSLSDVVLHLMAEAIRRASPPEPVPQTHTAEFPHDGAAPLTEKQADRES